MIDDFLISKLPKVHDLCIEYNVVTLYAFGSIVDGRFVEGKSDIDLLVEFDQENFTPKENARDFFKLWLALQKIFNCKVDLITTEHIEDKFFKKYLNLYKKEIYSKPTK